MQGMEIHNLSELWALSLMLFYFTVEQILLVINEGYICSYVYPYRVPTVHKSYLYDITNMI